MPGHAAFAPQQISPQRFDISNAAAHMLPSVQAASPAHMHAPSMHASPVPQHVVPHIGPVVHDPDGSQLNPSRGTDASIPLLVAP
jgi:hypothetical protein